MSLCSVLQNKKTNSDIINNEMKKDNVINKWEKNDGIKKFSMLKYMVICYSR